MYCVTNKKLNYLEKLPYYLGGVAKEEFNDKYIIPKTFDNIFYKEIRVQCGTVSEYCLQDAILLFFALDQKGKHLNYIRSMSSDP